MNAGGFSPNARMDTAYSTVVMTRLLVTKDKNARKLANEWKKVVSSEEVFNDVKVAIDIKI